MRTDFKLRLGTASDFDELMNSGELLVYEFDNT